MKPNVAFLSVVPSPYQRDLFSALAQRHELDFHVFYLEAAAPDSPWPEKPLAAYETVLAGRWLPFGAARCHINWRLPDVSQYDVVVLNSLMSLTAQWLMRVKLPGSRRPWIFWGEQQRQHESGMKKSLHDFLSEPLRRAAAIVSVGTRAQHDYSRRFPEPKHFCIPYHTGLRPFLDAPRNAASRKEMVFFFCGQMIARKGVDTLLDAFAKVVASAAPEAKPRLLLVGREAELPALLQKLPQAARERVTYAGFQAPEDLPKYFAQADVFVLPSRYDGWGVVVNQALGAGLPVICSAAVGAGHDLVEDEINGIKFPPDDVAALTRAMTRFVAEPELAARWGAASRRKALEWLPECGAAKWAEVIQNVLA